MGETHICDKLKYLHQLKTLPHLTMLLAVLVYPNIHLWTVLCLVALDSILLVCTYYVKLTFLFIYLFFHEYYELVLTYIQIVFSIILRLDRTLTINGNPRKQLV